LRVSVVLQAFFISAGVNVCFIALKFMMGMVRRCYNEDFTARTSATESDPVAPPPHATPTWQGLE